MVLCNKCGSVAEVEQEIKEYPYYCPECDENLYSFEISTIKEVLNMDNKAVYTCPDCGESDVDNLEIMNPEEHRFLHVYCSTCSYIFEVDTEPAEKPKTARMSYAKELLTACKFTLKTLENMTTEEFSRGADRPIRDLLSSLTARIENNYFKEV